MAWSLLHAFVAMPRRLLALPAEALFREGSGEVSLVSGEISLEDFAFADTVMVPDLPLEAMPASYRAAHPTYITFEEEQATTPPASFRSLLATYEWQREDVLRAAWIGLATLVLIATVAAVALTR